jgi:GNAT superfamily N-acetyltransferase
MNLTFRQAIEDDLVALVNMLADDELGANREDNRSPLNQAYLAAFTHLNADPNNELIVVESEDNVGVKRLVGMLQLTFIAYLTHIGSWRCLIEGVRIHSNYRGQGLGGQFFQWAIHRAKEKECNMVQLTSDKERPDAIRFYEGLGFVASHEGMKLKL